MFLLVLIAGLLAPATTALAQTAKENTRAGEARRKAQPGASARKRDPSERERARGHFEAGQSAYAAGKLERARAELEMADALMPSPELAFNLALVCERSGRAAEAVRYYQRYLATASPPPAEQRRVATKMRELSALAARQRGQLKLPPPSSDELTAEARRFFSRGLRLYQREQFDGALAAFTAAYRLRQTPELLFNLAAISEVLGRKRDAIDYYEAYLRKLPKAEDAAQVRQRIAKLEE